MLNFSKQLKHRLTQFFPSAVGANPPTSKKEGNFTMASEVADEASGSSELNDVGTNLFTTANEGQNESSLSFFPSAAGAKPATINKDKSDFTSASEKADKCKHSSAWSAAEANPPTSSNEPNFTTTSEEENEHLYSFFLSAVGAKPASTLKNNEAGFTIFYAVIIVSAVITLGVTITGIYQRQALLITSSEASTRAFYAADTAIECALFYDDRRMNTFAGTTGNSNIACAGDSTVSVSNSCSGSCGYTFTLNDTGDANVCAVVEIDKTSASDGEYDTRIEARGRNTCEASDRQAERALRTAY